MKIDIHGVASYRDVSCSGRGKLGKLASIVDSAGDDQGRAVPCGQDIGHIFISAPGWFLPAVVSSRDRHQDPAKAVEIVEGVRDLSMPFHVPIFASGCVLPHVFDVPDCISPQRRQYQLGKTAVSG